MEFADDLKPAVRDRKGGTVVAKLVSAGESSPRRFGADEGVFVVPDDFDAPLPEVLRTFQS